MRKQRGGLRIRHGAQPAAAAKSSARRCRKPRSNGSRPASRRACLPSSPISTKKTKKGGWDRERRVVAKAEHIDGKENPRFVVTLAGGGPMGRAQSCTKNSTAPAATWRTASKSSSACSPTGSARRRMRANQMRLYLSAMAYVLVSGLRRLGLKGTELAQAQVSTIRTQAAQDRRTDPGQRAARLALDGVQLSVEEPIRPCVRAVASVACAGQLSGGPLQPLLEIFPPRPLAEPCAASGCARAFSRIWEHPGDMPAVLHYTRYTGVYRFSACLARTSSWRTNQTVNGASVRNLDSSHQARDRPTGGVRQLLHSSF